MRNIVFRYDSSPSFARALRAEDQELTPPPGESVAEGEWVLAIFEVGARRRATAAAARGLLRGSTPVLAFERRDWERLVDFADAPSVSVGAVPAARPANPASVPPPTPSEPPAAPARAQEPVATSPSESRIHNRAALGIPGASTATRPSLDRTALGIPPAAPLAVPASHAPPAAPRAPAPAPPPPPAPAPTRPSLEQTSLGMPSVEPPSPDLGRTQAWPAAWPSPAPSSRASVPGTPTSPARPPTSPGAPIARVLLVDDDRSVCEIVTAMLDAVGLAVESVGHAEKALESLRASRYDLLVLDWNLPGMTGIELCRLLRKDAKLATLPIIFLSARTASQDIVDAFASGGDDYVSKPFRAPELGARIFGLLRRARMVAELP